MALPHTSLRVLFFTDVSSIGSQCRSLHQSRPVIFAIRNRHQWSQPFGPIAGFLYTYPFFLPSPTRFQITRFPNTKAHASEILYPRVLNYLYLSGVIFLSTVFAECFVNGCWFFPSSDLSLSNARPSVPRKFNRHPGLTRLNTTFFSHVFFSWFFRPFALIKISLTIVQFGRN